MFCGTFRTAEENANRGGVVWHDDGTVKDDAAKEHTMYQRDKADSALTFQESAKIGNTSEASLADTAPPQIPVPATSTIPDADQSSLAAVQQAATTAADPVTELADSSVAPSTSTVQTTDTDRMSSQPQATASNGIAHNAKPSEAADGAAAETDASMHSQPASSLPEDEAMTTEQQAAGTEAPQLSEHNEGIAEHASAPANTTTDACDLDGQQHDAAAQADTAAVDDSAGPRAMDTAARTAEQQPSDTGPASTDDTAATSVSAAPAAATSIEEAAADTATDADAAATETTATTAAPTDTAAAAPAATAGGGGGNSWRGTGKGPGLGQSQEFSGGPMNFARPKYRHAPYNLPPPRGGERFGPGPGSTWSPRGRGSPRGGMAPAPGRGFNDPLRSAIAPAYIVDATRLAIRIGVKAWWCVYVHCASFA